MKNEQTKGRMLLVARVEFPFEVAINLFVSEVHE